MNTRNLFTSFVMAIVIAMFSSTTADDGNLFGLLLSICVGGWFGNTLHKQGASFVDVVILCTLALIMSVGIRAGLVMANT